MIAAMPHIRSHIPMPRKPPFTPSKVQKAALTRYTDAYKAVYGIIPTVTFDGAWAKIQGQPQRVRLYRLREMTTQLRNRANL